MPRVIVVGGGIAGLASAYLIEQHARAAGKPVAVSLLEANALPGGSTRTERIEGFLCEWGPNGFLDNEPATLKLIDTLGMRERLVAADDAASKRYIYHSGAMHEVPLKPPEFLKSSIVSRRAKLRMAMEFFIRAKRSEEDESVDAFGRRRLGNEFADLLLDPMVSGIFAGNSKTLSLKAVFPKMVEMEQEYGGLFRAMIAKAKQAKAERVEDGGPAGPSGKLHTFREGMGELTSELSRRLADRILVSAPVQSLSYNDSGWEVHTDDATFVAESVVLACPSYAAADILSEFAPATASNLHKIEYAPVDVVCHGHRLADVQHSLDGFGVLIPRNQGMRMLGSLWCNAIFPGQAPLGLHLLRTMIGGAHDPSVKKLSDDTIESLVSAEQRELFGISAEPLFRKLIRHERGIAQYTIGHLQRVAATEALERELPGLYFTGASYRGVSVNGCVKDAYRVAEACTKVMAEIS